MVAKWNRVSVVVFGLIMLAVVAIPTRASAATINFESFSGSQYFSGTSVTEAGFQVSHTGSFAYILVNQGSSLAGNGTERLTSFNTSTITITAVSGGLFNFTAFDGAESWASLPHGWATGITVAGFDASSALVISQLFTLDLIKDPLFGFQSFAASGFSNLSRIEFTGNCGSRACNPEFSIDNLAVTEVTAVPEPGTLALLGFGLASAAALRRKKQKRLLP